MNTFASSIYTTLKKSTRTFITFPSTTGLALAFTIVTMIRIVLDWEYQEPYNFLFNCLHWSFAIGAFISLTSVTYSRTKFGTTMSWIFANLAGPVSSLISFVLFYFYGAPDTIDQYSRYQRLSDLSITRGTMVIVVSLLLFILFSGNVFEKYDFSDAFFMFHKSFFIALIYGGILMAGTSGIAGAIQSLLYKDMSEKVYMHLGAIVAFLSFLLFVGYFPDFKKGTTDEHIEIARNHSRFIDILFNFILIPIILALTVVLLIWTGREVISSGETSFLQLEGIATAFAATGIWLHIMVTHNDPPIAIFFRRVYPLTALFILAAEAWTLIVQLMDSGLKIVTYSFTLIWIASVASIILLLVIKEKSHAIIALILSAIAVISVLPVIGYHALPVTAQVSRLERLLTSENILREGILNPASEEPDEITKESITDAVLYLSRYDDTRLPDWFNPDLSSPTTFEETLGFEQTYPKSDDYYYSPRDVISTNLNNPGGPIDISGYDWELPMNRYGYDEELVINGHTYSFDWDPYNDNDIPVLTVTKDGELLLEETMNDYLDQLLKKYPPGSQTEYKEELSNIDMDEFIVTYETSDLSLMVIFDYIGVYMNPQEDRINYEIVLNSIYVRGK